MDIKELLKKYWFIGIVGLVMIAFIIAYSINKPIDETYKVESLKKEGKSVVYTLNGDDYYFADDLYNDLYKVYGSNNAANSFFRAVINKAVPDSDDLSTYAYNWSQYIMQNNTEEDIDSAMKQSGYNGIDELIKYCLDYLKQDQFTNDFLSNNYDTCINPVITKQNPRKVWHILVKVENITTGTDEDGNITYILNTTEEEENKINEILEALKTKSFEDVAKEFSDDSSGENGGYLGLVYEDNKGNYVTPFANATMDLYYGEVSEPVTTEYGWHLIKVEKPTDEELLNDTNFHSIIENENSVNILQAIMNKADELGFVIYDENLKKYIEDQLKESEAE